MKTLKIKWWKRPVAILIVLAIWQIGMALGVLSYEDIIIILLVLILFD